MENRYYTPDIEDLRVGYECEIETNTQWKPIILKYGVSEDDNGEFIVTEKDGCYHYYQKSLRTPYLSKEEIRLESWIYVGQLTERTSEFINNENRELRLFFNEESYRIRIGTAINDQKFDGIVKSINEFRIICKLLNI